MSDVEKMSKTKKPTEMCWSREETIYLLSIYKKFPILYDQSRPEFNNIQLRKKALMKITNEMQKVKPKITSNCIKRKIHVIKSQIFVEKKRKLDWLNNIDQLTIPDKMYKPKLWCYYDAIFLRQYEKDADDSGVPTSSTNNDSMQSLDDKMVIKLESDDECDEYLGTIEPPEASNTQLKIDAAYEMYMPESTTQRSSLNESPASTSTNNNSTNCSMKLTTLGKEDAFCSYLSTELKTFQLEETFDKFRVEIFGLIAKLKTEEREKLMTGMKRRK